MRIALGILALAAVAALALFAFSAESRYQAAEALFHRGDFEKSLIQCEKALMRNPRHAPARALKMELEFILGQGKAASYNVHYDQFMRGGLTLLIEIDRALQRAESHRRAGDREAAKAELRKVLELAKWMPSGDEMDARLHEVEVLRARLVMDGSPDD